MKSTSPPSRKMREKGGAPSHLRSLLFFFLVLLCGVCVAESRDYV
jgi:hypothetical protein